jgi:hypothetical protein
MTHKKHEIAVFIENEEMLREARELLEKYYECIDIDTFELSLSYCYLEYAEFDKDWFIADSDYLIIINLPQLEEILKNQ